MSTEKKGRRVKLTDAEKQLAEARFEDGYTFGVYETVEALEKYTGYSPKELLGVLVNRGAITQERCDAIVQKYGVE